MAARLAGVSMMLGTMALTQIDDSASSSALGRGHENRSRRYIDDSARAPGHRPHRFTTREEAGRRIHPNQMIPGIEARRSDGVHRKAARHMNTRVQRGRRTEEPGYVCLDAEVQAFMKDHSIVVAIRKCVELLRGVNRNVNCGPCGNEASDHRAAERASASGNDGLSAR
jgi:hypothetical protein